MKKYDLYPPSFHKSMMYFMIKVFLILMMVLLSYQSDSISIKFINRSGHQIQTYWINYQTGELVMFNAQINDGDFVSLSSFADHQFQIRELPDATSGECGSEGLSKKSCRITYVTVKENDYNIFINPDMRIEKGNGDTDIKQPTTVSSMISPPTDEILLCEKRALEKASTSSMMTTGEKNDMNPPPPSQTPMIITSVIKDLTDCVASSVTRKLTQANEEIAYQESSREKISQLLENYTCADQHLPTTPGFETRYWVDERAVASRQIHLDKNSPSDEDRRILVATKQVQVLHERKASQIHLVKNFISDEECQAVESAAKGHLHRATTADGLGGSHFSESRKALQAGIKVPWDEEAEGHPIAVLLRRVYDYTNHATGYNISIDGQEDLMSIQYVGRGDNDPSPDRYLPHCDGDCTGLPHKKGGRVATMVMYCTVPEKGGATNFMNAGVHVNPERGAAAFFSYLNKDDNVMDKRFTQHSACPVLEGHKKIAVMWMRLGVDSENPWHSFNTLTMKYSDVEEE